MVKTGGPYLERGESIILTTDRVRVNMVQYDVILTTHHLILVETSHTRFQPKMYPLISIQSVRGGKTTNGELVISLIFNDTGIESSGPMVLVFFQQPGEQRASERDEWIKKLMKHIVSGHQVKSNNVGPPADDQKRGIVPSVRRTFAPEISHPYKTSPDIGPAHAEMIIIPDEPEPPVFSDDTEQKIIPAPQIVDEKPEGYDQIIPSPDTAQPPVLDTETIPAGSEKVIELTDTMALADLPDTGALTTAREEFSRTISIPVTSTTEEIPMDSGNDSGSPELLTLQDQSTSSSFYDSPEEEPESPAEKNTEEGSAESLSGYVPEVPSPPPDTTPIPPGTGFRKRTFIAVTAIMVFILLFAALALNLSATRVESVVEPVHVPTTTIQQTIPGPTQIAIPPTGIWVLVKYPGNFYGWLGSPGSLKGVNSSGSAVYRIPDSAEIIQVNMYKRDNSGDPLNVGVFRDGRVLTNRTVSAPMGFIELLIDAKTGIPPGLTPLVTPANQTGSQIGRIMYF